MARVAKVALVAALLLLPALLLGVVTSFLSTPLLWRLEKPTGLELAGHSGPAEAVFLVAIAFFWALLLVGAWLVFRARRRPAAETD
ncbi:MAG: hypothetical protein QF893_05085 [Alphaproteobacteria bacterium]|jgi:hypothetical protein|nr:hypothetical protein [Alphaproteobacteria bacterium]